MSDIDYRNGGRPAIPATARLASDRQSAFIDRLFTEREVTQDDHDLRSITRTMTEASFLIDRLTKRPLKRAVHQDGKAITEGHYLQVDTVYVVVKSQANRLYAKKLVSTRRGSARWEYAPNAMRHLTTADRLTLADAKAMGVRLGVCVICGRTLTDPDSVEAGIGPVCAAKVG